MEDTCQFWDEQADGMGVNMFMCIHMCMNMYVCTYVCMYIYIYNIFLYIYSTYVSTVCVYSILQYIIVVYMCVYHIGRPKPTLPDISHYCTTPLSYVTALLFTQAP